MNEEKQSTGLQLPLSPSVSPSASALDQTLVPLFPQELDYEIQQQLQSSSFQVEGEQSDNKETEIQKELESTHSHHPQEETIQKEKRKKRKFQEKILEKFY